MKKAYRSLSLFVVLAMLTGIVLSVGCGGGGSGGWVGALFGAVAIVAVISATGGSGAPMIFAANVKQPTAEIRFAYNPTLKFKGRVRLLGQTPKLVDLMIKDDNTSLSLNTTLDSVTPGDQQVLIEVLPEGSDIAMFKAMSTPTVSAGNTESITPEINFTSTAKVLAYETWDGKDTNSFAKFDPPVASITALADLVKNDIIAKSIDANGDIVPVATFTFSATVTQEADKVADATPVPVPTTEPMGVPLPATRLVDVDVTQPASQVEIAVSESIKTLVNGFRISERASLNASAIPAGVPVLGGNEAVNINWLMGNLLAALPTGGNIDNGVFVDVTDPNSMKYSVATFTASTNTLEVADVSHYYNMGVMTKYLKKTMKITGCAATVNNGTLTQLSIQAGSSIEVKEYNRDGSLSGTVTIKLVSGVKIEMTNSLTADTGFITFATFGTTSYGLLKSLSGTESMKVTFDGSSATFDVTISEDGKLTTGTIAISSLSGNYTITSPIAIGVSATKNGSADPVVNMGAFERKEWLTGETQTNALVFANDTFKFGFNVNWNSGEVTLQNGMIELKNVNKQTPKAGETDANYSFSDGTASMMVKYNGTNYAQYGYIYSLQFAISKMSFDPANPTAAGEGTQVIVTKTNSDKTVDTLTYAIKNQMPVLQTGSDSRFAGGNEKVTELNGETIVEGSVIAARSADATAAKLQVNYRSVKNARGEISTRAVVKQATTTRTMFFTRQTTRVIGGHVYEGELTSETGTPAGNFSAANGTGSLNFGGATTQFRVQN